MSLADENDTDLLRFTRTSGDASGDRDATDGIVDAMRSKRRKKKSLFPVLQSHQSKGGGRNLTIEHFTPRVAEPWPLFLCFYFCHEHLLERAAGMAMLESVAARSVHFACQPPNHPHATLLLG